MPQHRDGGSHFEEQRSQGRWASSVRRPTKDAKLSSNFGQGKNDILNR
jgi:hypothetical protein